jgi:hypothetical protein
MAGDEQPRQAAVTNPRLRQSRFDAEQCIDTAVAAEVDLAKHLLSAKVARRKLGRREQQFGSGVDRRAIVFLGPRELGIVGAKPRFDMGHWHSRSKGGEGGTKRARSVALHYE